MGKLIYEDEVDRIELTDGDWADIKKKMAYGDEQALAAYYMKVNAQFEDIKKGIAVEFDLKTGNVMLLVQNIAAWSIKDREGNPAEISLENVSRLDRKDSTKLIEAIRKRNPSPKA